INEDTDHIEITGTTGMDIADDTPPEKDADTENQKIMVMVGTDRMGYGDDELGKKLMASFIKTLKEIGLYCQTGNIDNQHESWIDTSFLFEMLQLKLDFGPGDKISFKNSLVILAVI
ncbi:hypothetical protein ACFLZT_07635, partial [Thermodesulfobacteriota bacterium]